MNTVKSFGIQLSLPLSVNAEHCIAEELRSEATVLHLISFQQKKQSVDF